MDKVVRFIYYIYNYRLLYYLPMEMLKKKKNNSEYEIDRELTGKFAIEKNAEYQERIAELEEENKKLNIKVASLEGEIKGLNYTIDRLHKEIEELEKQPPRFSDFGGYDLDNNK